MCNLDIKSLYFIIGNSNYLLRCADYRLIFHSCNFSAKMQDGIPLRTERVSLWQSFRIEDVLLPVLWFQCDWWGQCRMCRLPLVQQKVPDVMARWIGIWCACFNDFAGLMNDPTSTSRFSMPSQSSFSIWIWHGPANSTSPWEWYISSREA